MACYIQCYSKSVTAVRPSRNQVPHSESWRTHFIKPASPDWLFAQRICALESTAASPFVESVAALLAVANWFTGYGYLRKAGVAREIYIVQSCQEGYRAQEFLGYLHSRRSSPGGKFTKTQVRLIYQTFVGPYSPSGTWDRLILQK